MREIEKADYPAVAEKLAERSAAVSGAYSTADAAALFDDIVETLDAMSPQIYEYFRQVQDLAKEVAHMILEREAFEMQTFPKPMLKTDLSGRDGQACARFGKALTKACGAGYLLAERYEELGKALAAGGRP